VKISPGHGFYEVCTYTGGCIIGDEDPGRVSFLGEDLPKPKVTILLGSLANDVLCSYAIHVSRSCTRQYHSPLNTKLMILSPVVLSHTSNPSPSLDSRITRSSPFARLSMLQLMMLTFAPGTYDTLCITNIPYAAEPPPALPVDAAVGAIDAVDVAAGTLSVTRPQPSTDMGLGPRNMTELAGWEWAEEVMLCIKEALQQMWVVAPVSKIHSVGRSKGLRDAELGDLGLRHLCMSGEYMTRPGSEGGREDGIEVGGEGGLEVGGEGGGEEVCVLRFW
jgi:hypothetical protein